MASKKPKKAKAVDQAKAKDIGPQITERKLKTLLGKCRSTYKDQRALSGELGAAIAAAAEHDHLHKKAFTIIRSLDRLEPEKLAELLSALEYYLDISGLQQRAESAQRLPMDDDEPGEDEDASESNVVHMAAAE